MPKRSTLIHLSNNTDFNLGRINNKVCEGKWTDGSQPPPDRIQPKTHALWQSESGAGSFATGTEAWVIYQLDATDPTDSSISAPELVYIHWDNPFVWDKGTTPIDYQVVTTSVTPYCDRGPFYDGIPIGFDDTRAPKPVIRPAWHELFIAGISSNGKGVSFGPPGSTSADWTEGWSIALNWPTVITAAIIQVLEDVNVKLTLGLRHKGSVDQTIYSFYDGAQGLKAWTSKAGQPSLKKLCNF